MKKVMVLFMAGALVLASANVYAKSGCSKKKGFEKKVFSMLKTIYMNQEELEVSDEQLDKLKDLKVDFKKELIKTNAEVELLKVDIHSMMWEDEIDTKKINELVDSKYELKAKKSKATIAAYADVKKVLSEEQEDKLKEMMIGQMKSKKPTCPVQK